MTKETKDLLHYLLISTLILTPFYTTFFFKEYLLHGFLISLILGGLNYFFTKKTSFLYINKNYYITLLIINIAFLLLQLNR
jgi:hypothetical protein